MINYKLKKVISIVLVMVVALCCISYAKRNNPYEGEVDEPVAEVKNNISEATIIHKDPYEEYNPLNPVKPGINKEEYDSVDNYIVDLNTIESRIKYFSPTYTNIKSSAESSYWMSFYARGGNDTLLYNSKQYTEEIYDLMTTFKETINSLTYQRSILDKKDPDYKNKYDTLTAQINGYKNMYSTTRITYNATNATINSTKSMLGISGALYNIGNLDNNNKVAFARRSVTKAISSVVLTYLQLSEYSEILEKQMNLQYDMYLLKKKNYDLGLATAIDVSTSLDQYEDAKSSFKATETTLENVKEQVAINLGYKISDIDKLVFVEPDVDLNYISSINFESDKTRAYTSNSAYNTIRISDRDKKLPQSTGEELFHKRQEYTSNIIIAEFENIYNDLLSKKLLYDSSLYLKEICIINDEANLRKFNNNLVSELEYKGLELQNLANKLQVKVAKYDLINATNAYYYASLGDITIY